MVDWKRRKQEILIFDIEQVLRSFTINNRWGTCSDCPKDQKTGFQLIENCSLTKRIDHKLGFSDLKSFYGKKIFKLGILHCPDFESIFELIRHFYKVVCPSLNLSI